MQPAIRIHVLGSVRVETVPPAAGRLTHTLRGLLGFLAVNRGRSHARSTLYALFWGDRPEARARHCLNTAVWRLRQVLEPAAEQRGRVLTCQPDGALGLRTGPGTWLDLEQFERAAHRLINDASSIGSRAELDALDAALQAPAGDLLEGFYEEWALEPRERCRLLYLAALTALSRGYRRLGAPDQAIRVGDTILGLDPFREDVLRDLMRAAAELGNRGLALRRYGEVRHRLRTELHVDPVPETVALHREISRGGALVRDEAASPAGPAPAGDSVAAGAIRELRHVRRRISALILRLQRTSRDPR